MEDRKFVDLHLHTSYSDGTCSPKQVVLDCVLSGLETIAIADHDHLDGYFEALPEAEKWGIELIPAVEVTTDDYHILAYDFDLGDKDFRDFIDDSRAIACEKAYKRVDKLQDLGFSITREYVASLFPGVSLGKVHVAMALLLHEDSRSKLETTDIAKIIKQYLTRSDEERAVSDGFFSPEYIIDRIHRVGGKAILAHPHKDVKDIKMLDDFVKYGIDGLEIQPRLVKEDDIFMKYALDHDLLITYGSDFHGSRYTKRPLLEYSDDRKLVPFWK